MTRRDYQRTYRQSYKFHTKRVNLTLPMSEYRRVKKLASRGGLPVATYIKRVAFAALDRRPELPAEIVAQLADLDRVIRNVANNVNQMARYSHRV
jgi:hypothetical protein